MNDSDQKINQILESINQMVSAAVIMHSEKMHSNYRQYHKVKEESYDPAMKQVATLLSSLIKEAS